MDLSRASGREVLRGSQGASRPRPWMVGLDADPALPNPGPRLIAGRPSDITSSTDWSPERDLPTDPRPPTDHHGPVSGSAARGTLLSVVAQPDVRRTRTRCGEQSLTPGLSNDVSWPLVAATARDRASPPATAGTGQRFAVAAARPDPDRASRAGQEETGRMPRSKAIATTSSPGSEGKNRPTG